MAVFGGLGPDESVCNMEQKPGPAPNPKWITSVSPEEHSAGSPGGETLHSHDSGGVFTLSSDGMSKLSDISLPEVCISSETKLVKDEMNYEIQQAYRIFTEFLMEKYKVIISPFLHPKVNEDQETQFGGVRSRCLVNVRQSMCLHRIKEKFTQQEYGSITEFVADFRLMLENCYRYHGVDHWLSKQAQKLEIMLEQKLTLLSRKLREKTTLAVTSKGRFGDGEEQTSSTSTRRRQTRSVKTLTVGGHESIMVQTLRVEEQQRAKEDKRQRELQKKEAEEMSAKEIDEWEQNLLSQASPHNVETLWELPAIGHFLCLAQSALNLPEIVFFELERCLLMPRSSNLLSKIMSSLLCPPQRRSTLHRRPVLPYRRWESELRQRVKFWYQSVGSSHDQTARAEVLGLCHQFFNVLGESSPLEAKAFHMLPFYQRVWLLKGLCDHVYETQKDIQVAVLAQPIHECRESILGYDGKDNAYIHFPHFCGADLRIYCQSPSKPPNLPLPSVLVKKVEILHKMEEAMPSIVKNTSEVSCKFDEKLVNVYRDCKIETNGENVDRCHSLLPKPREHIERSNDCDESKVQIHTKSSPIKGSIGKHFLIEEKSDLQSKMLEHEKRSLFPLFTNDVINERFSDEEHCYTGRSTAGSVNRSPLQHATGSVVLRDQRQSFVNKISHVKPEKCQWGCACSEPGIQLSLEHTYTSEEKVHDKILTKEKKKAKELLSNITPEQKWSQPKDEGLFCAESPKPSVPQCTAFKTKGKKRKHMSEGNALTIPKKIKNEPYVGSSFKLICTSLDDLRELINKTEDELDDLESTKKKMKQWYYRREAVKDLHCTLVRLLNELTPWEPKLIKAYQRNRLRLRKEFEVFRNHPEYSNFVREESISSSSSSSSTTSDDEGGELVFEQYSQSGHEDPEHLLPQAIGGSVKDFSTEDSADFPVTHISYNHEKRARSTSSVSLDNFLKNTCKSELNLQSLKSSPSCSAQKLTLQLQTFPLLKPNILHTSSKQPKSYIPVPTLLAKSVGNKVTLMKQPADHLEMDSKNEDSKVTVVSTGDINQLKFNNCSSGPPQNLPQKPNVLDTVHKQLNHVVGSCNSNLRYEEIKPQVLFLPPNILHKTDKKVSLLQQQCTDIIENNALLDSAVCTSTNVAGLIIPENGTLVQQVPPSEKPGLTQASVCSSNIPSFLRSQPNVISTAKSKGTHHCDKKTTPQCALDNITSAPSSLSTSTDSKQELKTVCIRESQSILVTTRGGNTGIVKVQKSSNQTGGVFKCPAITISPQFQACLVSKTSPYISSNTGQADTMSTVTTGSAVQMDVKTHSISSEVSKYLSTTSGSDGYTSTSNSGKPITALSGPLPVLKNVNPSLNSLVTAPGLTATDIISKSRLKQTNEDDGSHTARFVLISPSSHDVNLFSTKTLSTSVLLVNQHTTPKPSLIPIQSTNTVLKQAITTGAVPHVTTTSSAPSKMGFHTSSVKVEGVFVPSGTSTGPIEFPCLTTTTIPQNTQSSIKSCDTEQMITTTAQTVFAKTNVISSPATLHPSLKHLGVSSIIINSQTGSFTGPCTKSLSAENLKKKHGFSNTMWSSNSRVNAATSQSITNPLSALSLNNPFMSNVSGNVEETFLSPPLSFTRTQDHSTVHRLTTTSAATGSVQQQMIINTSTRLAGGTHIVLNNGHFVVPPQGLGPGSHVIVLSSHAEKVPPTVKKEATVPYESMGKGQVLQPSSRLPSVPEIGSPVEACTSVTCAVQATSPIIAVPTAVYQINSVAKSPFLQSMNTANISTFPSAGPLVSTVLNASTTATASLGLSLPCASPILSSNVSIQPIKSDPAHLLKVTSAPYSQELMSPAQMTKGPSAKSLAAQGPSQHPTIRVASISSSTSTALLHMGLGSVSVQKPKQSLVHPVSTTAQTNGDISFVLSPGTQTLPCSGGTVKAVELTPPMNNSTCNVGAHSLPFGKKTSHCPVIVTNPAMEKHLQQPSFLEMQNPCPTSEQLF